MTPPSAWFLESSHAAFRATTAADTQLARHFKTEIILTNKEYSSRSILLDCLTGLIYLFRVLIAYLNYNVLLLVVYAMESSQSD